MIYNLTHYELLDLRSDSTNISQLDQIDNDASIVIIDLSLLSIKEIITCANAMTRVKFIVIERNYNKNTHYSLLKANISNYVEVNSSDDLRKVIKYTAKIIDGNNIQIDTQKRVVYVDEHQVKLTKKELAIFIYLNEQRNKVCSREELITNILGYHAGAETRLIDVYVKYLRNKLGDEGKKIKTLRKVGYIYEN